MYLVTLYLMMLLGFFRVRFLVVVGVFWTSSSGCGGRTLPQSGTSRYQGVQHPTGVLSASGANWQQVTVMRARSSGRHRPGATVGSILEPPSEALFAGIWRDRNYVIGIHSGLELSSCGVKFTTIYLFNRNRVECAF